MSAQAIKELREKTGAGLMACKAALQESNGDIEAAIVCLRKKGLADMAKRAGRETKEGRTVIKTDGTYYAAVSIGCETDFVSNTPEFGAMTEKITDEVLAKKKEGDYSEDEAIKKEIEEIAPKFGENVSLKGAYNWTLSGGCGVLNYYIHSDNKKACLLELGCAKEEGACKGKEEELKKVAYTLAMQVVGMVALYVDEKDVPADVIEKEKEIATTQAKNEGKSDEAIAKMLPGRVNKFFKDVVLLNQPTIKDNKETVKDYLARVSKELGCELVVKRFVKF
ncbi:elongation factor Ts [Parelusimicrobium proximum]|uniref:translation elongation factor Ts n=1 Tax=Parelusimicrobium proximum TaxID=3228953 RepID=UPI003D1789D0